MVSDSAQPEIVQLEIPEQIIAHGGTEILRIWVGSDGQQYFNVRSGSWDDPAAWGILMVDLARLIARSYEATGSRSASAALKRLLDGFRAEVGDPMDSLTGKLLE